MQYGGSGRKNDAGLTVGNSLLTKRSPAFGLSVVAGVPELPFSNEIIVDSFCDYKR